MVHVFVAGETPGTSERKHVFPTDTRSQQQQIDDLLQEIHDEVEIDSHRPDPARDVSDR